MPFGHWRSFAGCVADVQAKQDYSDEQAARVCGKLKHELEKADHEEQQEKLRKSIKLK